MDSPFTHFRSETMSLYQIIFQSELVYNCLAELGELGCVKFRDSCPNISIENRKFIHEIKKCQEIERKLEFLFERLKYCNIPPMDVDFPVKAPTRRGLIEIDNLTDELEKHLTEVFPFFFVKSNNVFS